MMSMTKNLQYGKWQYYQLSDWNAGKRKDFKEYVKGW